MPIKCIFRTHFGLRHEKSAENKKWVKYIYIYTQYTYTHTEIRSFECSPKTCEWWWGGGGQDRYLFHNPGSDESRCENHSNTTVVKP